MRSTIYGFSGTTLGIMLILFSIYHASVRETYDIYDGRPGILVLIGLGMFAGSLLLLVLGFPRSNSKRKSVEPHLEFASVVVASIQSAAAIVALLIGGSLFFPGLAWLLIPTGAVFILGIGKIFGWDEVEEDSGVATQRR